MSIRFSTFRPKAIGVFATSSPDQRLQCGLTDLPVSTETPKGYYLMVKVPGIGYFLPKFRYEEVNSEWRVK